MRGRWQGWGDSAAAKGIHREAAPGPRLRTKTHGPLQNTPSRDQNPLRLRVPPRSVALTHTQKESSGGYHSVVSPSTHTPSHCSVTGARECLGLKTENTRARTQRARALWRFPGCKAPQFSPTVPPPTQLPSYWPDQEGGGDNPLQVPPSPLAKLWAARPPSLATAWTPSCS